MHALLHTCFVVSISAQYYFQPGSADFQAAPGAGISSTVINNIYPNSAQQSVHRTENHGYVVPEPINQAAYQQKSTYVSPQHPATGHLAKQYNSFHQSSNNGADFNYMQYAQPSLQVEHSRASYGDAGARKKYSYTTVASAGNAFRNLNVPEISETDSSSYFIPSAFTVAPSISPTSSSSSIDSSSSYNSPANNSPSYVSAPAASPPNSRQTSVSETGYSYPAPPLTASRARNYGYSASVVTAGNQFIPSNPTHVSANSHIRVMHNNPIPHQQAVHQQSTYNGLQKQSEIKSMAYNSNTINQSGNYRPEVNNAAANIHTARHGQYVLGANTRIIDGRNAPVMHFAATAPTNAPTVYPLRTPPSAVHPFAAVNNNPGQVLGQFYPYTASTAVNSVSSTTYSSTNGPSRSYNSPAISSPSYTSANNPTSYNHQTASITPNSNSVPHSASSYTFTTSAATEGSSNSFNPSASAVDSRNSIMFPVVPPAIVSSYDVTTSQSVANAPIVMPQQVTHQYATNYGAVHNGPTNSNSIYSPVGYTLRPGSSPAAHSGVALTPAPVATISNSPTAPTYSNSPSIVNAPSSTIISNINTLPAITTGFSSSLVASGPGVAVPNNQFVRLDPLTASGNSNLQQVNQDYANVKQATEHGQNTVIGNVTHSQNSVQPDDAASKYPASADEATTTTASQSQYNGSDAASGSSGSGTPSVINDGTSSVDSSYKNETATNSSEPDVNSIDLRVSEETDNTQKVLLDGSLVPVIKPSSSTTEESQQQPDVTSTITQSDKNQPDVSSGNSVTPKETANAEKAAEGQGADLGDNTAVINNNNAAVTEDNELEDITQRGNIPDIDNSGLSASSDSGQSTATESEIPINASSTDSTDNEDDGPDSSNNLFAVNNTSYRYAAATNPINSYVYAAAALPNTADLSGSSESSNDPSTASGTADTNLAAFYLSESIKRGSNLQVLPANHSLLSNTSTVAAAENATSPYLSASILRLLGI